MSSDQQKPDQAHGEVNASRGPAKAGGSTSNPSAQAGSANTNTDGAVDYRSGPDGSTTAEGANADGADSSDTQNTMASSLRPATDSERKDLYASFFAEEESVPNLTAQANRANTNGTVNNRTAPQDTTALTPANGNRNSSMGAFDPPYHEIFGNDSGSW